MIVFLLLVAALLGFTIFWMEKRMRTTFQSLSFEMMERNQRTFFALAKESFDKEKSEIDQKQKSFEALVTPLKEAMQSIHSHQREDSASLKQQIQGLVQSEARLRQETSQLSSALRSPPARGAWGQVHLRRVVELAGLVNQCDFEEQVSSTEADGKLRRPDLIVHLPGKRQIIVDAKVPLTAYMEAAELQDGDARQQKMEAYAGHLRRHIRELSQKDYWKRFELSPEFVVLFLPAESFFSAALQVDPTLIEVAAEQNLILATPTTLIAVLRGVAQAWKQEALSKNAEQIARLGQELYDRLTTFVDYWSKVGKSLNSSVESYNQAISSLESRVLVSARKLKEHGAAPVKGELEHPEPIDKIARLL